MLNHTSDQHVWFQKSRRAAPGDLWRDYYVWSDEPTKYKEARIIFQNYELSNWIYDPIAKSCFWHRFFSHQTDLNYDNPEVRSAASKILDFWLDLSVDGLRLDAVPYLLILSKVREICVSCLPASLPERKLARSRWSIPRQSSLEWVRMAI